MPKGSNYDKEISASLLTEATLKVKTVLLLHSNSFQYYWPQFEGFICLPLQNDGKNQTASILI